MTPHQISLNEAAAMTSRFRANRENILAARYQNLDILPLSETFERSAVDAILARSGCSGLRIYYGMDELLKVHAILVGSDEKNNDILPPHQNTLQETEDDYLAELSIRCPPTCPGDGSLNDD